MNSEQTKRGWALVWLSPVLLCAIACLQIYLAMTKSLSPWKGGGFGMFSTVDSPDARFLRIYLINGGEETPVLLPDNLKTMGLKAQTIPSSALLFKLAQRLAKGTWAPYRMTDPVRYYQSNQLRGAGSSDALRGLVEPSVPEPNKRNEISPHTVKMSADGQVVFPKLLKMSEGEPGSASPDAVVFQRVRVELWKYHFEVGSSQLKAAKYMEVVVHAQP